MQNWTAVVALVLSLWLYPDPGLAGTGGVAPERQLSMLSVPTPDGETLAVPSRRIPGDRSIFDASRGNNFDAALQATNCREFLTTYLPQEASFGAPHFYLKLLSNDRAEHSLREGADLRTYRSTVRIAYLVITVDPGLWRSAAHHFQKLLGTMFLPMLRSLYPNADIYLTIYDGRNAVANGNWKRKVAAPRSDLD